MMCAKKLIATVLALSMVSCGDSDDGADTTGGVDETPARPGSVVADEPAVTDVRLATDATVESFTDPVTGANSGESVYNRACVGCHLSGAAGAPRVGDQAAWADRIGKGEEALVQSAISGVPGTAMLARGTCHSCTDDEISAAVDYMLSQSQ